ncbi:MAG: flagellar basal body-associated FliL family protein [Pseudomonadota bacterium]
MAKADDLDLAEDKQGGDKKSSSKLLLIILIILLSLVLLTGAVVGTLWATGFFSHKPDTQGESADAAGDAADVAPEDAPEEKEKGGPAMYVKLDPPFVVNFDGQGKARFLQVTVEMMGREEEKMKEAEKHIPAIRNSLLMLLSSQTYDKISTVEGKQALREEAMAAIKEILDQELGESPVEGVFFTSFVMQ